MTFSSIAFVFARGGSKGVPRKNLRVIGGVPLVVRAIDCAAQCPEIDAVVVSTDDEEIADVARRAGALVPELRPAHLATDNASELEAWRHAVGWFADADGQPTFDLFVSVPPTAPLRTPTDVRRCIAAYRERECDIVVTGTFAHRHPSFNMVEVAPDGLARLMMPRAGGVVRRQDAPPAYDLATVAYVCSAQHVLTTPSVLAGRVRLVEVDRVSAVDIDDELDLALAEVLSERTRHHDD